MDLIDKYGVDAITSRSRRSPVRTRMCACPSDMNVRIVVK
jgi:hypothetical protein